MDLNFDLLTAAEIECRIGTTKQPTKDKPGGVSLLLYKDARCDMARLDKTVGAMNWQREHTRDNANCKVSIWDDEKKVWVTKEDVGVASRTEAEKGIASDSFKRSCVNWGIGRELYTAPFIWVSGDPDKLKWERFKVKAIGYDDKRSINALTIVDKSNKVVFQMGKIEEIEPDTPDSDDRQNTVKADEIRKAINKDAPAKVEIAAKLPNEAEKPKNPVFVYLNKEKAFMQQMLEIADPEEMRAAFGNMRQRLIDGGIIKDIPPEELTMEQAKQMVDAMYANYFSDKKETA